MTEKVSKKWKRFKKEFKKVHQEVDVDILDYIAVEEILRTHLEGLHLDWIVNTFQLSPDYVKMVLEEFLGLEPRNDRLDYVPLQIFYNKLIDEEKFKRIMRLRGIKEDIDKLYDACIEFDRISSEIDEFYEKY